MLDLRKMTGLFCAFVVCGVDGKSVVDDETAPMWSEIRLPGCQVFLNGEISLKTRSLVSIPLSE